MKKGYVLLLIPILLGTVLVVFTATKANIGVKQTSSTEEIEHVKAEEFKNVKAEELENGMLVFMGGECVGWFSPDLNVIGRTDIAKYFTENQIKPKEAEILNHFASLGWKVTGASKKGEYTTEYQLKRLKTKN